jgi:hypothetical protein
LNFSDHQILREEPDEDAGAATLQNYEYQFHLAAQACCAMIADETGIVRVVCERHEDYITVYASGEVQLFSAKHRETGPWTLKQLVNDGGIRHLYRLWKNHRHVRCVVQTNAGLQTGAGSPTRVLASGRGSDPEQKREAARVLGALLDADLAVAAKFLRQLDVQHSLPDKRAIAAFNRDQLVGPMLGLRCIAGLIRPTYEVILSNVKRASQAGDMADGQALITMANPRRNDPDAVSGRILENRSLTRAGLIRALVEVGVDFRGKSISFHDTLPRKLPASLILAEEASDSNPSVFHHGTVKIPMPLLGHWMALLVEVRDQALGSAAKELLDQAIDAGLEADHLTNFLALMLTEASAAEESISSRAALPVARTGDAGFGKAEILACYWEVISETEGPGMRAVSRQLGRDDKRLRVDLFQELLDYAEHVSSIWDGVTRGASWVINTEDLNGRTLRLNIEPSVSPRALSRLLAGAGYRPEGGGVPRQPGRQSSN